MNHSLNDIRESINRLSDQELIEMVGLKKSEYTEEALELAREAMVKRGLW